MSVMHTPPPLKRRARSVFTCCHHTFDETSPIHLLPSSLGRLLRSLDISSPTLSFHYRSATRTTLHTWAVIPMAAHGSIASDPALFSNRPIRTFISTPSPVTRPVVSSNLTKHAHGLPHNKSAFQNDSPVRTASQKPAILLYTFLPILLAPTPPYCFRSPEPQHR